MSALTNKQLASAILVLSDKKSQSIVAKAVAAYLVKERRSNELDAVMREVKRQRQANEGIVEADIVSAFPATDKDVKEMMKLIGVEKYVVNKIVDPEIVGGVRLETSGKSLDLSVRNRLTKLREGVKVQ